MDKDKIKRQALKFNWERWVERHFGAFILSLFGHGATKEYMKKVGVDAEYKCWLFNDGFWYESKDITIPFKNQLIKNMAAGVGILEVSKFCESFYKIKKKEIANLLKSNINLNKKLKIAYEILTTVTTYIWLAHGFEDVYDEILHQEVPKYFSGDIEKFIGDISFPVKKNSHSLMEDDILADRPVEDIIKKFGWIKVRDGFSNPLNKDDILSLKKDLIRNPPKEFKLNYEIPAGIQHLVKECQELVYYRTFRTDVFYEFIFTLKPIFENVAKSFGLKFQELENYSILDLIDGKPVKYSRNVSAIDYQGHLVFYNEQIFDTPVYNNILEIRGSVAAKGIVSGRAKIVTNVEEINKIKEGDIMVTFMTAPSFITAMKKAAGFVTNEGGLTCHAAIIAREMQKPCIIGTKIATEVFKDGDLIEVNANKGVVRKIK